MMESISENRDLPALVGRSTWHSIYVATSGTYKEKSSMLGQVYSDRMRCKFVIYII